MKNLDHVECRYRDCAGLLRSYTAALAVLSAQPVPLVTTLGIADTWLEGVNLNIEKISLEKFSIKRKLSI